MSFLTSMESFFSSISNELTQLSNGMTIEDMLFNHLDPYGKVKPLDDYEIDDLTEDEVKEFNTARRDYNRDHKCEIQNAHERERLEREEIRNDPSMN